MTVDAAINLCFTLNAYLLISISDQLLTEYKYWTPAVHTSELPRLQVRNSLAAW